MAQVTWRAPDEVVERVRDGARRSGRSLNDYVTRVLSAATDPELAGDEAERVRERLDRAGLLEDLRPVPARPSADRLAAARAAASVGTPLSELVSRGRG